MLELALAITIREAVFAIFHLWRRCIREKEICLTFVWYHSIEIIFTSEQRFFA
jgi:hypothetical protein